MSAHSMPTTRGLRWWLRLGAPSVLVSFLVVFGISGVAYAFFSSSDSSNFSAAVGDALPAGSAPTATATGTTIAINFAQVSTTSNRLVATYKINRYAAATPGTIAATFACTWSSTAPNCAELNVPAGTWLYSDTAELGTNWLGAESAKSSSVAVNSPTITSANPSSRGVGATGQVVTITGTNFVSGSTATFSNGITGSAVFTSATTLTGTFNLASATAGAATITVDNHNGTTATNSTAFTVVGIPTVNAASPASATVGATNQNVIITGTNFIAGATASFSNNVTVNSTTYTDATHLTANISLTSATLGATTIAVNDNDGGTAGSPASVFTVTAAPVVPSVTSTNPASRGIGATSQNITITGTGFVSGATATFSNGVTVNGATTFVSATQLTANITVPVGATPGATTVTVNNNNGAATGSAAVFTVTGVPTITSVAPNSRGKGGTNQNVIITGTNFVTGASAVFTNGITVNSTTITDATHITANISLTAATVGTGTVTINNNNGGTISSSAAFTVNAAPTMTNPTTASPAQVPRNTTNGTVTITGANFAAGTTVAFANGPEVPGVTVASYTSISATSIVIKVNTGGNGSRGLYDITVTNADGGAVTVLNSFQITN